MINFYMQRTLSDADINFITNLLADKEFVKAKTAFDVLYKKIHIGVYTNKTPFVFIHNPVYYNTTTSTLFSFLEMAKGDKWSIIDDYDKTYDYDDFIVNYVTYSNKFHKYPEVKNENLCIKFNDGFFWCVNKNLIV